MLTPVVRELRDLIPAEVSLTDVEVATPLDQLARLETELSLVHEELHRATIERDRALNRLRAMHSKVLAAKHVLT
jgi:hypothetical protein